MSIGWWRDADAIFGTHTIGHTKGGFSWVGPCLFPRPIGITLGTGMVSQARICPNVAPSPDREPPRGQPGNVQRDANTERVRQSARLPDSGATCRTQRKTRATHSPEYRSVSAGVRSQSRPIHRCFWRHQVYEPVTVLDGSEQMFGAWARPTWRRKIASSCRSTTISRSFELSLRNRNVRSVSTRRTRT